MDRATAALAARTVAEVAREHADESERARRLAKPVVDAFEASGLAGLVMPTALGGAAAHPAIMADVVEIISAGDASAGWACGIGIGSNFMPSMLDPTIAKELFNDPSKGSLSVFAPTGRLTTEGDRLRLNGRWSFASNCQQAAAASVGTLRFKDGAPVIGPEGPIIEVAFISPDDFAVDETWDMTGMRGTGSHDIVSTDVDLTEAHITTLFGPKWSDDALFRLRTFDVLVPCLSPVPLGIGRAALDAVNAHVAAHGDEKQRGPRVPFGVDAVGQLAMSQAEVRLRAARALMHDALDDAYNHALKGDVPPREVSALIGLAGLEALAAGNQAVDTACKVLGTSASREGSLLDRLRRDVISAGGHVLFGMTNAAPLGRQLAGMHTVHSPFLPED